MPGELINDGGDNKAQLPPLSKEFSGLVDRKIPPYNRVIISQDVKFESNDRFHIKEVYW